MSKTEASDVPSAVGPDVAFALEQAGGSPAVTDETEALIKEARQHQRRRWTIGPLSWRIDVGSQLHETDDSGTTWRTVTPNPKLALGAVSSVAFSSPTNGTAIGDLPWCSPTSIQGTSEAVCYQTLIVTSDGGVDWHPAQF